jgi:hypothetical protein
LPWIILKKTFAKRKKQKMKKGEVQLHESIFVTFFILVIIVLGLIVFYKFSLNSLHNYESEYREQQLLSSLISVPNDVAYTYLGNPENAIDTSKLFYDNLDYGFRTIVIQQTYPEVPETLLCDINNYPNCNTYILYNKTSYNLKNTFVESVPASLYFPLDNKYRSGKITIYLHY